MYNIFAADDGSMLWEVRVHGIYYQVTALAGRGAGPRCMGARAAILLSTQCNIDATSLPYTFAMLLSPAPPLAQPMDFSHFPFDSFDLALELRFYDPTRLISTEELYGYNHSGITVVPSSGGTKASLPAVATQQALFATRAWLLTLRRWRFS